jgi:hypothetical protein
MEGDRLSISYNEGQSNLRFVAGTPDPAESEPEATGTPEPEAKSLFLNTTLPLHSPAS